MSAFFLPLWQLKAFQESEREGIAMHDDAVRDMKLDEHEERLLAFEAAVFGKPDVATRMLAILKAEIERLAKEESERPRTEFASGYRNGVAFSLGVLERLQAE